MQTSGEMKKLEELGGAQSLVKSTWLAEKRCCKGNISTEWKGIRNEGSSAPSMTFRAQFSRLCGRIARWNIHNKFIGRNCLQAISLQDYLQRAPLAHMQVPWGSDASGVILALRVIVVILCEYASSFDDNSQASMYPG